MKKLVIVFTAGFLIFWSIPIRSFATAEFSVSTSMLAQLYEALQRVTEQISELTSENSSIQPSKNIFPTNSLTSPDNIIILSPTAADIFWVGQSNKIVWKVPQRISLSKVEGCMKIPNLHCDLVGYVAGHGDKFIFWTPDPQALWFPNSETWIRISDGDNQSEYVDSGHFPVLMPHGNIDGLVVDFPVVGGTWRLGNMERIQWTPETEGPYTHIALYKLGQYIRTIYAGKSEENKFAWSVPRDIPAGNNFQVEVIEFINGGNGVSGWSGLFSVLNDRASSSTSSVSVALDAYNEAAAGVARFGRRVIFLKNGNQWKHGTVQTIIWDKSVFSGRYVKITLVPTDSKYKDVVVSRLAHNDGDFRVTVKKEWGLNTKYKVKIASPDVNSVVSESDVIMIER